VRTNPEATVLKHLIATRPTLDRSAKGTAASFAVHTLIFATLIIASANRDQDVFTGATERDIPIVPYVHERPEPITPSSAPPAPPVPTEPTPPTVEPPTEVPPSPTNIPTDIPAPGPTTVLPSEPVTTAPSTGEPGTGEPTGEPGLAPTGALTAGEVDRPASLLPHTTLPRYPDMLRSSRLEGGVRVVFIVGADGRVEMESVRIVEASHPLFAAAVRAALPRMRFRPAQAGSRRVRQLVEIPFGFTLTGR
jgi:protein TonB